MPRVIIRSRRARIATIAAWIAVAVIVGAVAWRDTTVSALAAAGWMGALGWAITMMWWLPELELNQDAVVNDALGFFGTVFGDLASPGGDSAYTRGSAGLHA